jgi:hypothetical protein
MSQQMSGKKSRHSKATGWVSDPPRTNLTNTFG